MTRQLVVKGESIAGKSDVEQAALVFNPLRFCSRRRMKVHGIVAVRRAKRVGPEGMLDVVGQQLLVLLFVMQTKYDAAGYFLGWIGGQQALDSFLYMTSVLEDGLDGGPGEGGAQLFFRLIGDGVVRAVEKPAEVCVEFAVAVEELAQQEGLEKPGGVRQMPFGWACLGAGLHHHVFGRQGKTKLLALAPYLYKFFKQTGSRFRRCSG